jgi:enoyl-CoA hydratase
MTAIKTNEAGEPLVKIERPAEGVARIVLNRAEKRNAQNFAMLYQLDEAFTTCARDEDVAVIILAADGPDFSSGHDLKQRDVQPTDFDVLGNWAEFAAPGAEGRYAWKKKSISTLPNGGATYRSLPSRRCRAAAFRAD